MSSRTIPARRTVSTLRGERGQFLPRPAAVDQFVPVDVGDLSSVDEALCEGLTIHDGPPAALPLVRRRPREEDSAFIARLASWQESGETFVRRSGRQAVERHMALQEYGGEAEVTSAIVGYHEVPIRQYPDGGIRFPRGYFDFPARPEFADKPCPDVDTDTDADID